MGASSWGTVFVYYENREIEFLFLFLFLLYGQFRLNAVRDNVHRKVF